VFKKTVAVLGAGPAGLLAAHAARELGYDVTVYTAPGSDGQPQKSELHGCQYLHAHIPDAGVPKQGTNVHYLLEGHADDYRRKVYGEGWDGSVSPDEYGPEKAHMAWNLRVAYDVLWEDMRPLMKALYVSPQMAARVREVKKQIVLATVPAPALCLDMDNHKFSSQSIWAMGSTREDFATSRSLPYYAPDFTVLCNGNKSPHWYRAATVFGQSTLEWPGGSKPPINGVAAVRKPLSTDCACHVGKHWHRLGRFGKWQKGYLAHQAYFDTLEILG
jgi:hypothetical protein